MKRSTERILTTHTGSLPRPQELLPLLFAREDGQVDIAALERAVRDAVADVVRKQAECGVDVLNDGEMGKVGRLGTTHPGGNYAGIDRIRQDVRPTPCHTECERNDKQFRV
jgi:hypothetical protein